LKTFSAVLSVSLRSLRLKFRFNAEDTEIFQD